MPIWFLSRKPRSSSIQKIDVTGDRTYQMKDLKDQIDSLDREIYEVTQALVQAQLVRLRTSFSQNTNWLGNLQQRWYQASSRESASWHKDRLLFLQQKRRKLKYQLEHLTGAYWPNQLRRLIAIAALVIILALGIWILFMGMITALYLLPIWGSILIIYLLLKQRITRL